MILAEDEIQSLTNDANHISEDSVPMFFSNQASPYKFTQLKSIGEDVKVSQNNFIASANSYARLVCDPNFPNWGVSEFRIKILRDGYISIGINCMDVTNPA